MKCMAESKSKPLKCITINTDASFSKEHKVGGFAFYIVCDRFKIFKGGMFRVNPVNPMEAEMMCMANTIYTLTIQKDLPSTNLIVINSDCLYSFDKIGRKKPHPIGKKVANLLRELRIKTSYLDVIKPKFEFRHVKAHTGNKNGRSLANEWCDKEAKKWMRKAINQKNNL